MLFYALTLIALSSPPPPVVDLRSYASTKPNLAFSENRGQWNADAKFLARSNGLDFWVTSHGFTYDFYRDTKTPNIRLDPRGSQLGFQNDKTGKFSRKRMGQVVNVEFVGASKGAYVQVSDKKSAYENYFQGSDSRSWVSGVGRFGTATVHGIYPGIDLIAHFDRNSGRPAYDFIAHPGADIRRIRMKYIGANDVGISVNGEVVLTTRFGNVTERGLTAFQPVSRWSVSDKSTTQRLSVAAQLNGDGSVGFAVPKARPDRLLVIDPIVWATYDGSRGGGDEGIGLVMNGQDTVYTGLTDSPTFPSTTGEYQSSNAGNIDCYVTSLGQYGYTAWTTYLGGKNLDFPYSIAADKSGELYVTGETMSVGSFPTTAGAYRQSTPLNALAGQVFLSKLSGDGKNLLYSTYFGGANVSVGRAVAVDGDGAAYVTGWTGAHKFPVSAGAPQTTHGGGDWDAFAVKISPNGSSMVWGTYLGGNDDDLGLGITVDAAKNTYVVGNALSPNFPVTSSALQKNFGGGGVYGDAFVSEISADGKSLVSSSYLGGSDDDVATSVNVDSGGSVYVAGTTASENFPVTSGAFQTVNKGGESIANGNGDIFVAKLSAKAQRIVWSTFIGGNGGEAIINSFLDSSNNLIYTGGTSSTDLPVTAGAYQTKYGGNEDGLVGKLSNDGKKMMYLSYLGGSGEDVGWGVGLDPSGNIHTVGWTNSLDFPMTSLNQRTPLGGGSDAFVVKLDTVPSTPPAPLYFYDSNYGTWVGGDTIVGNVQLSTTVNSDTTINLVSSSTSVIPSTSFIVPATQSWTNVSVPTKVVSGPNQSVVIQVTVGSKKLAKTITLLPLYTVAVDRSTVIGGNPIVETVTLTRASLSDVVLKLSGGTAFASVPATLTIPAGQMKGSFTITTRKPTASTMAKIVTSFGGCFQSAAITITPN